MLKEEETKRKKEGKNEDKRRKKTLVGTQITKESLYKRGSLIMLLEKEK